MPVAVARDRAAVALTPRHRRLRHDRHRALRGAGVGRPLLQVGDLLAGELVARLERRRSSVARTLASRSPIACRTASRSGWYFAGVPWKLELRRVLGHVERGGRGRRRSGACAPACVAGTTLWSFASCVGAPAPSSLDAHAELDERLRDPLRSPFLSPRRTRRRRSRSPRTSTPALAACAAHSSSGQGRAGAPARRTGTASASAPAPTRPGRERCRRPAGKRRRDAPSLPSRRRRGSRRGTPRRRCARRRDERVELRLVEHHLQIGAAREGLDEPGGRERAVELVPELALHVGGVGRLVAGGERLLHRCEPLEDRLGLVALEARLGDDVELDWLEPVLRLRDVEQVHVVADGDPRLELRLPWRARRARARFSAES